MIAKVNYRSFILGALSLLAVISLCWQASAGSRKTSEERAVSGRETEPSGEELWTMNCQRCHNLRTPTMYSNAQWEVIVHHMRVRANITGEEQRAILEFLKSASH